MIVFYNRSLKEWESLIREKKEKTETLGTDRLTDFQGFWFSYKMQMLLDSWFSALVLSGNY